MLQKVEAHEEKGSLEPVSCCQCVMISINDTPDRLTAHMNIGKLNTGSVLPVSIRGTGKGFKQGEIKHGKIKGIFYRFPNKA